MTMSKLEAEAKRAYERSTDNDPIVHSNRFPLWSELSELERQKWRNQVRELRSDIG